MFAIHEAYLRISLLLAVVLNFPTSRVSAEPIRLPLSDLLEPDQILRNPRNNSLDPFLTANLTDSSALLSPGIHIQCLPVGPNQDTESCNDALQHAAFAPGSPAEVFTWARRESGLAFQIPLPQRTVSCKASPGTLRGSL